MKKYELLTILKANLDTDEIDKVISREQDLLDIMRGQIVTKSTATENKAKEIVNQAKIDANIQKEEILQSANEEASKRLKDTESIISKQKAEAYKEIKDVVVDVAFDATKKILEREVNKDDNQKIIDDFVTKINDNKEE